MKIGTMKIGTITSKRNTGIMKIDLKTTDIDEMITNAYSTPKSGDKKKHQHAYNDL